MKNSRRHTVAKHGHRIRRLNLDQIVELLRNAKPGAVVTIRIAPKTPTKQTVILE